MLKLQPDLSGNPFFADINFNQSYKRLQKKIGNGRRK